jgi:PAS domain S-box-containing protein
MRRVGAVVPHPKEPDELASVLREERTNSLSSPEVESRGEDAEAELREVRACLRPILAVAGIPASDVLNEKEDVDSARALHALHNALRRLSVFAANTPLAVIEWSPDLAVVAWSPRAQALFGWSQDEALALSRSDWRFTHPDDTPVASASLAQHHPGETDSACTVFQVRNYARDGRLLHCEWYNVVLTDADGTSTSVLSLVQDVTARVQAETEKAELLAQQTRIAETLQRSLLLIPSSPLLPGLELATFYASSLDEAYVGGDFYDAFALSRTRAALVLGDVTGKGLQAAAYMAETKFALRAFLREHKHAGKALGRLNRFFFDAVRYDDPGRTAFACLTVAIFDHETGIMEVAVAGAEPPILRREENSGVVARELSVSGSLLGTDPDADFEVLHWPLKPGDVLCMATDGISEARRVVIGSPNHRSVRYYEFFGPEGIRRVAEAPLTVQAPVEELARRLYETARAFAGGSLSDDACLLIARWQGT